MKYIVIPLFFLIADIVAILFGTFLWMPGCFIKWVFLSLWNFEYAEWSRVTEYEHDSVWSSTINKGQDNPLETYKMFWIPLTLKTLKEMLE